MVTTYCRFGFVSVSTSWFSISCLLVLLLEIPVWGISEVIDETKMHRMVPFTYTPENTLTKNEPSSSALFSVEVAVGVGGTDELSSAGFGVGTWKFH